MFNAPGAEHVPVTVVVTTCGGEEYVTVETLDTVAVTVLVTLLFRNCIYQKKVACASCLVDIEYGHNQDLYIKICRYYPHTSL